MPLRVGHCVAVTPDQPRIGIICPPDHDTFGPVATRLRERGFSVAFLEPGVELAAARLDRLDLLVNKKVRWASLHALQYAYRNGVAAWNDYVVSTIFLNRLSQLGALAAAGFDVPPVRTDKPDGDYVAKHFLDIHDEPTLNGEGDFYQPVLDFDGVDRKYYAVDDGQTVHTAVVEFESKLYGERQYLGRGTPDPAVERPIERLLRFTGARALGIDVVRVDGDPYAVDVNPATSFRRTDLEGPLADSITTAVPG